MSSNPVDTGQQLGSCLNEVVPHKDTLYIYIVFDGNVHKIISIKTCYNPLSPLYEGERENYSVFLCCIYLVTMVMVLSHSRFSEHAVAVVVSIFPSTHIDTTCIKVAIMFKPILLMIEHEKHQTEQKENLIGLALSVTHTDARKRAHTHTPSHTLTHTHTHIYT